MYTDWYCGTFCGHHSAAVYSIHLEFVQIIGVTSQRLVKTDNTCVIDFEWKVIALDGVLANATTDKTDVFILGKNLKIELRGIFEIAPENTENFNVYSIFGKHFIRKNICFFEKLGLPVCYKAKRTCYMLLDQEKIWSSAEDIHATTAQPAAY